MIDVRRFHMSADLLQTNIFRGTPYGHVSLGTVAGLTAITLDDVRRFAGVMYTKANLSIGVSGDAPESVERFLIPDPGKNPRGIEAFILSIRMFENVNNSIKQNLWG